ncbi:hypothetical protein [Streptomyces sp. CNQ085]|uniref:hypothetical protein n=1 Tax=Streptomyces sp. CNQ085 TaxID=2886944 RepID=UPI0035AD7895
MDEDGYAGLPAVASARAVARREVSAAEVVEAALARLARLPLTPVMPNRPHGHDGPGDRYSTALTWSFNLSGHPVVGVPAGFTGGGCPAGLQIVAARGGEALLASVAHAAGGAGLVVRAPGGEG